MAKGRDLFDIVEGLAKGKDSRVRMRPAASGNEAELDQLRKERVAVGELLRGL